MNILLTTMSLSIGGAETHILDLAAALQRRGHAVTIASAGGILEARAREVGIACVHAPLDQPSPAAMLRAERILDRLIRTVPFDLIHAHARIPAFVCGRLARAHRIPMVTTAHYPFRITPLLRRITDWGDGTLAVSCHIKDYLIREYHLPEQSVALTVNGIDTDRFSPAPLSAKPPVTDPPRTHSLLHVSRLDPESDAAARALIRIAPRIKAAFPDFTLTLAGDGKTGRELREMAKSLPYVRFLGARTDIPDLLRAADLFVGVSRAALEAMAVGVPTVLSGNQGQLGLYTPAIEAPAIASNFCCMTPLTPASDGELLAAIREGFALSPAARGEMAKTNRETVLSHFSIARMADDAEALYERVLPPPENAPRILIGGYYGYGNCGDEYLLGGMIRALRREMPRSPITVLSASPRKTARAFAVDSIHRLDPALLPTLKRTALYLCGGGSLLTDRPSLRSLRYYTAMIALARQNHCRIMLYAAGIGPFSSEISRTLAKNAIKSAHAVTVRDEISLAHAKALGAVRPILTADPAFDCPPPDPVWIAYRLRTLGIEPDTRFVLALRPLVGASENWEPRLAACIRRLAALSGKAPLFAVMHESEDRPLAARLAKQTGGAVLPPLTGEELRGIFRACSFAVPMRLHAAILAKQAEIPLFCLSYDPKTDAFCSENRLPHAAASRAGAEFSSQMWKTLTNFTPGTDLPRRENPAQVAERLLRMR